MESAQYKKLGDVLCDIGKYVATAVPLTYFVSDKPGMTYVIMGAALFSVMFICFGLYFTKKGDMYSATGKSNKRRIRVMKNAVFQIEEQQV